MSDIRYIADKLYESNDEYISKRDASLTVNAAVTGSESKETMEALAAVLVNIYHVPLADVAPVVHGQWETYAYEDGFVCAVCSSCKWNSGAMWWGYAIKHFDFCPHCGAKMDEEQILSRM